MVGKALRVGVRVRGSVPSCGWRVLGAHHVLGLLVGARVLDAAVELDDHRVARVDLEHALRLHELELALVGEGLALHDLAKQAEDAG